jgi:hypothetical protein
VLAELREDHRQGRGVEQRGRIRRRLTCRHGEEVRHGCELGHVRELDVPLHELDQPRGWLDTERGGE